MLQISKALFERWNSMYVRYCHWKSNEHLLEGLDGLTDLDVYVFPDDKHLAESALVDLGYVKFVPQKGSRYPMVDEWIGFDYATGKLIHVHLHYQIITGTKHNKEYIFPLDSVMIETRVQNANTNVYVIAPDLEIIILYARITLKAEDKHNIHPNADCQKEIDYLKGCISLEALHEYCRDLLKENGELFYQMVLKASLSAEEWNRMYLIVEAWLKPYRKYTKKTVRVRYWYFRFCNIWKAVCNQRFHTNYVVRKTLPDKGVSVCFLGADGSGKSTVSIEIQKWLNWKVEAKRFYLGSGDHYNSLTKQLLTKVSRLRGCSQSKNSSQKMSEILKIGDASKAPEKISFKRKILRWGYSVLQSTYLMEVAVHSYHEIKKANKYTKQGAIAIFDRFPQNQFANLYDGPKIAARFLTEGKGGIYVRLMAWIEEKAIVKAQKYQPVMVFKLHLSPEESIRRKPDHSWEEVAPKAEITPKLKFPYSTVYDVDATQEYDSEVLSIKRILWNEIVGK